MPPDDHPDYHLIAQALGRLGYEHLGRHASGFSEFERAESSYHTVSVPTGPHATARDLLQTLASQGVDMRELMDALQQISDGGGGTLQG